MFIALDENMRFRSAEETAPGRTYYCPVCSEPLSVRRGEIRHSFFAHYPGKTCTDSWAAEYETSDWHLEWQKEFPACNQEVVVQLGSVKHRADVLTGKTVIEFQHSQLSSDVFNKRNAFYHNLGYKTVWLFDVVEEYMSGKIFSEDNARFVWKNSKRTFRDFTVEHGKAEIFFQLTDDAENKSIIKVNNYGEKGFATFEACAWFSKSEFLDYFKCNNGTCPVPFFDEHRANEDYVAFKEKYGVVLDNQQERAVETTEGPVLVLAVPGSGKTTTLIARIAFLVNIKHVNGNNILALTFTNQSADDMKNRYQKQFGDNNDIEFQTIHSFSYKVVKKYLGNKNVDDYVSKRIMQNIFKDINPNEFYTDNDILSALSIISRIKNSMLADNEIMKIFIWNKPAKEIYDKYQEELTKRNIIDFDDQLILARDVLQNNPMALSEIQNTYKYIFVDEAQDTSKIQHEIIKLVSGKYNNVFMVGDEDQSIYRFRGAYPKALLDFNEIYPNPFVLKLETNYRSTKEIVDLSNEFISRNDNRYAKEMMSNRGEGEKPEQIIVENREGQYWDALKHIKENSNNEIAFLFRENANALPLADILTKQGISFNISKKNIMLFFNEHVVKDIRDFLKLAINPNDIYSFMNIYYKCDAYISAKEARGIYGKNKYDKVPLFEAIKKWFVYCHKEYKAEKFLECVEPLANMKPADAIRHINDNGYGQYLKEKGYGSNYVEILHFLARDDNSIPSFFSHLDELENKVKNCDNENARVLLSTIHGSKGMEYDKVFILDIYDGMFPSFSFEENPFEREEDEQEERRLLYVAMTRAKNKLYFYRIIDKDSAYISELFPTLNRYDSLNTLLFDNIEEEIFVRNVITNKTYGIRHLKNIIYSSQEFDVDTGEIDEEDKTSYIVNIMNGPFWELI